MNASSQHPDDAAFVSLVRTSRDLAAWSLPTLLAEYGELAIRQREAVQLGAPELEAIEQDMAEIANQLEQRVSA